MQFEATPCPGRSALAVGVGECGDCTRYDHDAPRSAIPATVYDTGLGVKVCSGRRVAVHGQRSIVDLAQMSPPKHGGLGIVSVIGRGDAR